MPPFDPAKVTPENVNESKWMDHDRGAGTHADGQSAERPSEEPSATGEGEPGRDEYR